MNSKPVIAIVGTTCSGKTATAIHLAKQHNGEVISADSRQVYEGLNIGTGKVTKEEMDDIPHHLIDTADPKDTYSVALFEKEGLSCIEDIHKRSKLPIIAGGTGQYVDALLYTQTIPEVPPNKELREKLEQQSTDHLFRQLQEKDPERAESIEPKNKRRLVRALEIVAAIGKVPTISDQAPRFNHLIIGLDIPKETLHEKIHTRLLERLESGMVEEAQQLHQQGLPFERFEELGLEYRYLKRYLAKELSYDEMVKQLEKEIRKYAKRQLTWWNNRDDVEWFTYTNQEDISKRVQEFLDTTHPQDHA